MENTRMRLVAKPAAFALKYYGKHENAAGCETGCIRVYTRQTPYK